jgi:hypothetical protein
MFIEIWRGKREGRWVLRVKKKRAIQGGRVTWIRRALRNREELGEMGAV